MHPNVRGPQPARYAEIVRRRRLERELLSGLTTDELDALTPREKAKRLVEATLRLYLRGEGTEAAVHAALDHHASTYEVTR